MLYKQPVDRVYHNKNKTNLLKKSTTLTMADTAIKNEEEKKEYFDKPAVLEQKVNRLAEMIRNS